MWPESTKEERDYKDNACITLAICVMGNCMRRLRTSKYVWKREKMQKGCDAWTQFFVTHMTNLVWIDSKMQGQAGEEAKAKEQHPGFQRGPPP